MMRGAYLYAHTVGLFFFSSRRRHTRCSRDWSSDVCSSDLERDGAPRGGGGDGAVIRGLGERRPSRPVGVELAAATVDCQRHVRRSVRGSESPNAIAVATPASRVGVGVGPLGVGGTARVLEIVEIGRAHV